MILVVGGTGVLGKELVRLLVARGAPVRVLARRPGTTPGVEHVRGDVRDASAVARAVAGVRAVVSAMHGFATDPRGIDLTGNQHLIEAAERAQIARFVLVSVHGAAPDHPIEMFRMKYAAEQLLRASALDWTVVRPTAFMETWLSLLARPLLEKKKTTIFGRGENPINFVSAHDVARLIDRALCDETCDENLRGKVLEIGGPENLSFDRFVDIVAEVMSIPGARRHVPVPLMRVMAPIMTLLHPLIGRQITAGVAMDTLDMCFDPRRPEASGPPAGRMPNPAATTPLAQVVRRELERIP